MRRAVCAAIAAIVVVGAPTAAFAAHAFKTRVSIAISRDKSQVEGKVKSKHASCADTRSVNVFSKTGRGKFHLDVTIPTDAVGNWASATNFATSTVTTRLYKAVVPRATVSDGACKGARSSAIKVRFKPAGA